MLHNPTPPPSAVRQVQNLVYADWHSAAPRLVGTSAGERSEAERACKGTMARPTAGADVEDRLFRLRDENGELKQRANEQAEVIKRYGVDACGGGACGRREAARARRSLVARRGACAD